MGGQGPVYQFASMSSVREVCTPSPHVTVWLLSMLRALGCDIQDFEESCEKNKQKNQGLWEESHWLWNKWKIQLHEMSLWKWVIQRRYLCRVRESFQKDLQDRSQVLLIVPSGTLLRSAGWTHMPLFHGHLLGFRFQSFAIAMELLEQGGPKVLWCHLNVTQRWRTSRQYYTSLANQWDAASHFQVESVSLELGWIGTIKVPGTTA